MKILIGYSTVFGTSASYAEKLEKQLDKNNLHCICREIDVYGQEWIRNYNGFLILFLSTTGSGGSPPNSTQFYETLKQLKSNNQQLNGIKFAIMGFGSTVYPQFCGFAKEIQSLLIQLGGQQIRRIQYCDSNLKQDKILGRKTKEIFDEWREQIVMELKSSKEVINGGDGTIAAVKFSQKINGLIEAKQMRRKSGDNQLISQIKLKNAIENYNKLPTAKVMEITQLRSKIHSDQEVTNQAPRSTLHIKLSKPSNQLALTPGCVINIYPENTSIKLKTTKLSSDQNFHIITQILKRVKLNQLASRQLINDIFNEEEIFTNMLKEEKLKAYNNCLKNKQLTVGDLIEKFQPNNFTFYSKLKLQAPRPYSLCSWSQNQEFIELCVSIVPNGVTSNYFISNPQSLKFTVSNSVFKIPKTTQPIMMICNGSGIAPFRSITQYYAENYAVQNNAPLKIYYGIQNQTTDYYFKREWIDFEKKGIVDIKIAQSRRNPEEKEYVQNIIDKDVISEHLFDKNGLVYICGGSVMTKSVKEIIIKSLRSRTNYEGEQLIRFFQQLRERSVIVEQIFH